MKERTLKALALLQIAYPNALDKDRLRLYVEMLGDIPAEILAAAVKYCINHYKFLPTIAEIREVAEKGMLLASGSVPISASEAWQEVKKAICAVGRYEKPHFSTPELQKTVERLGWQDICDSPLSNKEILYAQFRNAYTEEINRQKDIQNYLKAGVPVDAKYLSGLDKELKELSDSMNLENSLTTKKALKPEYT